MLQRRTSDVLLHTVGQHSTRKDEILASMFNVTESHELEHNKTALVKMSESVKVIGAEANPEENLYEIYISYVELNDAG